MVTELRARRCVAAMCASCPPPSAAEVPDYKERLAYGTDQGRWLLEQVGPRDATRRVRQTPQRAFHSLSDGHEAELEPRKPSRPASSTGGALAPSWSLAYVMAACALIGVVLLCVSALMHG